ncbi:MAG: class I SAM-dependent methyltransferase [Candidatus Thiodiazotropha lotti]|nr:class I SAM-dependent methyltransferase [Candidatus Thiodiazotropha lotti]
MLNDDERQVSKTRDGIRADHVARYEFAKNIISNNKPINDENHRVIDLACGVGYGTQILAEEGYNTIGVDRDKETIGFARKYYGHKNAGYVEADISDGINLHNKVDAAVCFETIEHIEDPEPLLSSLIFFSPLLIASVPNEEVFPNKNYAYHYRHYSKNEFNDLLEKCGWEVIKWYGQEGTESSVEEKVNGRTLIVVAKRNEETEYWSPPEHVSILGLGPSLPSYSDLVKRLGGRHAYCDEVWTINSLVDVYQSDLCFHMDDVRIQEIRAEARPESNIAQMLKWMPDNKVPIMTSRPHSGYPSLIAYPLELVINELKYDYFNSTAAYAVALAIFLGVKKISLFGIDFTYPNAHDAEKGRGCVEFWLGKATERNIDIALPKSTSLLDAVCSRQDRLYGYDTLDVDFQQDGEKLRLAMTEKDTLPTAEEIEAKYDHQSHPNQLVTGDCHG